MLWLHAFHIRYGYNIIDKSSGRKKQISKSHLRKHWFISKSGLECTVKFGMRKVWEFTPDGIPFPSFTHIDTYTLRQCITPPICMFLDSKMKPKKEACKSNPSPGAVRQQYYCPLKWHIQWTGDTYEKVIPPSYEKKKKRVRKTSGIFWTCSENVSITKAHTQK